VIVDAIVYVVDNGIKWRALPADFPPWPTVYKRFALCEKIGAMQRMLDGLRDRARAAAGRVAAPSAAAVIDSQSVRAAETVGRATRGWDTGIVRGWMLCRAGGSALADGGAGGLSAGIATGSRGR
jgi:transposase